MGPIEFPKKYVCTQKLSQEGDWKRDNSIIATDRDREKEINASEENNSSRQLLRCGHGRSSFEWVTDDEVGSIIVKVPLQKGKFEKKYEARVEDKLRYGIEVEFFKWLLVAQAFGKNRKKAQTIPVCPKLKHRFFLIYLIQSHIKLLNAFYVIAAWINKKLKNCFRIALKINKPPTTESQTTYKR